MTSIPVVAQASGGGNLAATVLDTQGIAGLYVLCLKAQGGNLEHHLSYFVTTSNGFDGCAFSVIHDFAYQGTRSWSVTFNNATNAALGSQVNSVFAGAGTSGKITISSGGATANWSYTLSRFALDAIG